MNTHKRPARHPHRLGPAKAGGATSSQGSTGMPQGQNHVFDSKGPDSRMRGTAQQLVERYQELARNATLHGDRVDVEHYSQYAEHYLRTRNAMQEAALESSGGHAGTRTQS